MKRWSDIVETSKRERQVNLKMVKIFSK